MQKPTLLQRVSHLFSRSAPTTTHHVRRFQGARVDRLAADWLATESSLNQELRNDLAKLRARGRDLVKNNDYAVKFAGMVRDNIIGPGGIRLQVRVEDGPGKPDRMASAAIEAAWSDYSMACDITGRQSLRDFCASLVGGLPSDGEFLVRVVRGADAGNKYGFALQMIDVDRIDTTCNIGATVNTNAIINGVEVDAYRRPVALHLFAAHPNDGVSSSRQRVRVLAGETLHCFKVERAEQVRGIPWMSAGMLSLHHLGNFKLSALLAAEHGANHYGFFTTPDGQNPVGSDEGNGETITTSQPGTYDTLPMGVQFTPHESKYPDEVFGPFVKTTLQRIASGWRVAYHSLANDLEGVSYSSIRSGALEERDRWAVDQEWFISVFMEPVYQMWLQMALMHGAITMPNGSALPASKLAKFSKHDWQARRWEWVDPKGDMDAKILAVKAGLMAPQDLANAMGYNFEDTLAAIAAAQKLAAELGVTMPAYDATPGAQSAQQQQQPQPQPANSKQQEVQTANARALDILTTAIGQLASKEQPAPVVNITNHMPEQRHETHNHIAPAAVEVRNQVNVPETTVHVEAIMPEQRSEAPVVNITNDVQPAPVTVNNTHPTKAVMVTKRDSNDEITGTETTYTHDK